ncbi:protein decapping 5 isoform X1 [Beta vulgaris subsp. vulgaris]|uniref:protein decapping 5 isoform X1 n=1 Tax=Beta vulgaris subsp. vulgaris TaxID=3555 RepID=UPI0020367FC3|nr:protein decapping 5 isoform X1 [Beta vulgaris subsp. vulgaris]
MAAEDSRSGGSGAADTYLGSLISLTSKSEIRYEGVLFNINTEEASIGLRNVRSFGTEGRRMDGPQVSISDKVYEYIVFRGSDIKDLQVKSSPPVQTAPPVHNDPAIIQSHYAAPTASSTLPPASVASAAGSLSDFSSQMSHPGVPISTYQNSNGTTLSAPMYWQGYYGPSGSLQTQQSLLRPVQGFSMPPSMQPPSAQQLVHYPTMSSSLPTGASNISVSQSMEFPAPLPQPIVSSTLSMQSNVHPVLPQPIVSSTLSMQSNVHPVQSYSLAADSSTNMMPLKTPAQVIPAVSQSTNSSLVSPALDKSTVAPLISNQANPVSSTSMPLKNLSESLSAVGGKSTSPVLVTPGQFLQPGPTILHTAQTAQTEQKDVEVVQVSSYVYPAQPSTVSVAATAMVPVSADAKAPLLPLPSPSNSKMNGGAPSQTRYTNRGGRERRRGNEFPHPAASFTEDFDFEAMNEKFKKDEVWGHLGKSKAKADEGLDLQDDDDYDDGDVSNADARHVYKKDDFFDTLSCNALDRESRNGRTRFSEQMRLDTETFGNFPRNRGFRGGRGPGGGRSRGGYYGRGNGNGYGYGYGYGGRGRGHNVYRAM